jgi:hypothetical protein
LEEGLPEGLLQLWGEQGGLVLALGRVERGRLVGEAFPLP